MDFIDNLLFRGFPARTDPFDVINHTTLDNIDSIRIDLWTPIDNNANKLKMLSYANREKLMEQTIFLLESNDLLYLENDLKELLDSVNSLIYYNENSAWSGKNYVFSKIKKSKKIIKYNEDSISFYWSYGCNIHLSKKYDGILSFSIYDSSSFVSIDRYGEQLYPYNHFYQYQVIFYRSLLEESLAKFMIKALKYKNKQIDSLNTIMSIDEAKIEKYDIKRLIPPRYLYLDTLDE